MLISARVNHSLHTSSYRVNGATKHFAVSYALFNQREKKKNLLGLEGRKVHLMLSNVVGHTSPPSNNSISRLKYAQREKAKLTMAWIQVAQGTSKPLDWSGAERKIDFTYHSRMNKGLKQFFDFNWKFLRYRIKHDALSAHDSQARVKSSVSIIISLKQNKKPFCRAENSFYFCFVQRLTNSPAI